MFVKQGMNFEFSLLAVLRKKVLSVKEIAMNQKGNAREEFQDATKNNGGTGVKEFIDGIGLAILVEQLGELKLGELLDTPPPGLDEAIAISKVSIMLCLFPCFLAAYMSLGCILTAEALAR